MLRLRCVYRMWPRLEQGVSQGEEAVLADSGREGEIVVRVGRVRSQDFLNGCSPFCGSAEWEIELAADDQKVARSNRWTGEAILRLQGLEGDAKPLGYFSERIAYADFIPVRGPGCGKLSVGRKWGEFVGWNLVKLLRYFFFCSHRNLQVVGLIAGRGRVSPELRV